MILFCWCCHPPPPAIDFVQSIWIWARVPLIHLIWVSWAVVHILLIIFRLCRAFECNFGWNLCTQCSISINSIVLLRLSSNVMLVVTVAVAVTVMVTMVVVGSGGNGTAATLSGSDCTNMTNASALMLNWIMCLSDTCTKQPATWIDLTKLT